MSHSREKRGPQREGYEKERGEREKGLDGAWEDLGGGREGVEGK